MKSFFKIINLFLCIIAINFNSTSVFAGNYFFKLKRKINSRFSSEQIILINDPAYSPINSEDGGKEYFKSWNGLFQDEYFNLFLEKYGNIIENERSARTLADSEKNELWNTIFLFGSYSRKFEEAESWIYGEYFLRVDYENKIIYTIRKSGDTYLCVFYLLIRDTNTENISALTNTYWILNESGPIKNIILPIDRELLD